LSARLRRVFASDRATSMLQLAVKVRPRCGPDPAAMGFQRALDRGGSNEPNDPSGKPMGFPPECHRLARWMLTLDATSNAVSPPECHRLARWMLTLDATSAPPLPRQLGCPSGPRISRPRGRAGRGESRSAPARLSHPGPIGQAAKTCRPRYRRPRIRRQREIPVPDAPATPMVRGAALGGKTPCR
jgi:hypothetical protein